MADKPGNDKDGGNNKAPSNFIIVHGEKYTTTFTKKYENRKKWVKPNEKNVVSVIPGTITEIFVKEGQTAKKGERMLLLEAMKMLNNIAFPLNGKIKKVNVKVGDKIPKGFLMVEYE
jgi:biotin carboxyl carrier protein